MRELLGWLVDLHDGSPSACVEIITQLLMTTSLPLLVCLRQVCLHALGHLPLYTPEPTYKWSRVSLNSHKYLAQWAVGQDVMKERVTLLIFVSHQGVRTTSAILNPSLEWDS